VAGEPDPGDAGVSPEAGTAVFDADAVMAEIEAEVRARRAAGDLPAGFERELDLIFARYAPVGAMGDDLESVLARGEQASFIDLAAPTESALPGVPLVKRLIRKMVFFYLHHIAEQITTLGLVLIRGVRLLGQRVERLEQAVGGGTGSRAVGDSPSAAPLAPSPELAHWEPLMADTFAPVRGRVLHAECGTGALVAALRRAGADAYGVEPVGERAEAADAAGIEARGVEVLDHLRALRESALGGLVLSGCVDRLPSLAQHELVALAASRLSAGTPLAILGTDPAAWLRAVGPVAADLAPGRPLHAETWARLLEAAGFSAVELHRGPAGDGLSPVPGTDEAVKALNANLERLGTLLFGPATYCVLGVAPGPGRP
jgi:hypothetical protein